jgi:hypothetical protein
LPRDPHHLSFFHIYLDSTPSFFITIIIIILHLLGHDRPLSASSNSFFKGPKVYQLVFVHSVSYLSSLIHTMFKISCLWVH